MAKHPCYDINIENIQTTENSITFDINTSKFPGGNTHCNYRVFYGQGQSADIYIKNGGPFRAIFNGLQPGTPYNFRFHPIVQGVQKASIYSTGPISTNAPLPPPYDACLDLQINTVVPDYNAIYIDVRQDSGKDCQYDVIYGPQGGQKVYFPTTIASGVDLRVTIPYLDSGTTYEIEFQKNGNPVGLPIVETTFVETMIVTPYATSLKVDIQNVPAGTYSIAHIISGTVHGNYTHSPPIVIDQSGRATYRIPQLDLLTEYILVLLDHATNAAVRSKVAKTIDPNTQALKNVNVTAYQNTAYISFENPNLDEAIDPKQLNVTYTLLVPNKKTWGPKTYEVDLDVKKDGSLYTIFVHSLKAGQQNYSITFKLTYIDSKNNKIDVVETVNINTLVERCTRPEDKNNVVAKRLYQGLNFDKTAHLFKKLMAKLFEAQQQIMEGNVNYYNADAITLRFLPAGGDTPAAAAAAAAAWVVKTGAAPKDPEKERFYLYKNTHDRVRFFCDNPFNDKDRLPFHLELYHLLWKNPTPGPNPPSKSLAFINYHFRKANGTPMTPEERYDYFQAGFPGGNTEFDFFAKTLVVTAQDGTIVTAEDGTPLKRGTKNNIGKGRPGPLTFVFRPSNVSDVKARVGYIFLYKQTFVQGRPAADQLLLHASIFNHTPKGSIDYKGNNKSLHYHVTDKCFDRHDFFQIENNAPIQSNRGEYVLDKSDVDKNGNPILTTTYSYEEYPVANPPNNPILYTQGVCVSPLTGEIQDGAKEEDIITKEKYGIKEPHPVLVYAKEKPREITWAQVYAPTTFVQGDNLAKRMITILQNKVAAQQGGRRRYKVTRKATKSKKTRKHSKVLRKKTHKSKAHRKTLKRA